MCGIVGIASQHPIPQPSVLTSMRDTMSHRGPDDSGAWWSENHTVGLGHRRLAIIDLSSCGHQPMSDSAKQLCVIFNGELYNYQDLRHELEGSGHSFQFNNDTEVLLESYRAWGPDCLSHLDGMFSFALYDQSARVLLLARDRAGEKPLFYSKTSNGTLVFASELKALMADPAFSRILDVNALNYYLAYGYVPAELCILKGVHKLAPGCALLFSLATGDIRKWRYWSLPAPFTYSDSLNEDELIDELKDLLQASVRRSLVADVPVGVMLSGGLDSSLITAVAATEASNPVRTFTASFPGHRVYDEAPHARLVAQHFSTVHSEIVVEPATVDLLPQLARQFDEPIGDSSMVPTYVLCRAIREHVKVVLGGDGGDELFGGYLHHSWIQKQPHLSRFLTASLKSYLRSVATFLPLGFKGRNYLLGCTEGPLAYIAPSNGLFDFKNRSHLVQAPSDSPDSVSPEAYRSSLCRAELTCLQNVTRADFLSYLADDILVKVDRASMLASLEVRSPWLSKDIINFAFGRVPDRLKATSHERKILLRGLAARLLPSSFDLKRKQGFSIPARAWLKGAWGKYIEGILAEADPEIFDRKAIRNLVSTQKLGFTNGQRLFALAFFELWRREYKVHL
jgi:asparagine synthase (glutamine-hydrolysing)